MTRDDTWSWQFQCHKKYKDTKTRKAFLKNYSSADNEKGWIAFPPKTFQVCNHFIYRSTYSTALHVNSIYGHICRHVSTAHVSNCIPYYFSSAVVVSDFPSLLWSEFTSSLVSLEPCCIFYPKVVDWFWTLHQVCWIQSFLSCWHSTPVLSCERVGFPVFVSSFHAVRLIAVTKYEIHRAAE